MITIEYYPGFMSRTINWEHVKISVFKGGEVNVTLSEKMIFALVHARTTLSTTSFKITARIKDSDTLMAFMLTVDAMRRIYPTANIHAVIPYFPYARQDRVCNTGEALSVKVVASMINSLELERVYVLDPHSSVTPALINNVIVMGPGKYVKQAADKIASNIEAGLWLMAPDQGAYKKVFDIAASGEYSGFLSAIKDRDPKTMAIKSVQIQGDVKGKHILIVDDICDGGRTFLELGRILREREAASIHLFVTHAIFSYGTSSLSELFDSVYTTDSFTSRASLAFESTEANIHWLPF